MGKTIYNFSFKGGIGKSTLSAIQAFLLAKRGKKVLLVDLDPQANATDMIFTTYQEMKPKKSLLYSLMNGNLNNSICHMSSNLDLLPSDWSMSLFNAELLKVAKEKRSLVLKNELEKIKENYDYIFIDTPPTLSETTNNALLASDYVTVIVQTQRASYKSAVKTVTYYAQVRNDYKADFKMVGAILYLVSSGKGVDEAVSEEAIDFFGDGLFQNRIYNRERVKKWAYDGISDNPKDVWDKRTLSMYNNLLNEMLVRIGDMDINE